MVNFDGFDLFFFFFFKSNETILGVYLLRLICFMAVVLHVLSTLCTSLPAPLTTTPSCSNTQTCTRPHSDGRSFLIHFQCFMYFNSSRLCGRRCHRVPYSADTDIADLIHLSGCKCRI